uniref:3'-5' exonuclease domain-containing protein n=1 Tax=Cuerna arida TaxID=1464854 RepID=A0A1B6G6L3_9HEMI
MLSKLFPSSVNFKHYLALFVPLGLTYVAYKNTNIQKYWRHILRKWSNDHKVTVIVSSEIDSKLAVEQLKRKLNERKVIGLDCEWVSNKGKRHPVALLQLSAPDGFCSLFHLCSLKSVPSELVICKKYGIWTRLFWDEKDYWYHSYNLWSSYIGLNFKIRSISSSNGSSSGRRTKPVDPVIRRNYNTLLHRVHYSNIFLLAPDRQVLCTISESKAAWYIEKGLVDIVCDDPKTLKLKFEPSNRSSEPDGYYTRPKDNRCVVCGNEADLRRKNVVPSEYRKYFDESLKNHHSHDVLLLCLSCHTRSNMFDQDLRDQLVIECNAPLADGKNNKLREMPELRALRSAARAIYFAGETIPEPRRTELLKIISDTLGIPIDDITTSFLENVINIEFVVESEQYVPHGQKVVEHYLSLGGVQDLERRWRQHFLNTMSPKYLPDL